MVPQPLVEGAAPRVKNLGFEAGAVRDTDTDIVGTNPRGSIPLSGTQLRYALQAEAGMRAQLLRHGRKTGWRAAMPSALHGHDPCAYPVLLRVSTVALPC